ncbi:MAG: head decoration protein [Gammaproteobacteria bacterium]
MAEYKTIGQSMQDNLIAGDFPIVTKGITIATGQILKRGALLGRVQASGKYLLSLAGANNGSENPVAILGADVDATSGDIESVCYFSGQFNTTALTFGTGHTATSAAHILRILNIYLTETV